VIGSGMVRSMEGRSTMRASVSSASTRMRGPGRRIAERERRPRIVERFYSLG
jgi:hypothetical protein